MERAKRPEPKPIDRSVNAVAHASIWAHGKLKPNPVDKFNVTLRYRAEKKDDPHTLEHRWYLVGALVIAFVQVFKEDHGIREGDWGCHIASRQGNAGNWFKTESEMHEFIRNELQRVPAI